MIAPPSILSIIDFSDSSYDVLKWAANMATQLNVSLTILHPYRLNQIEKKEDMFGVKKKIEQDAAKNFERMAVRIFKNRAVPYEFRPEVGFIQDRVQDYARRNNILLIVVGKDLLNESRETLTELIENAEVPLVIVP